MATSDSKPWWLKGVKFKCQASGKCCQSRGQYGFVYLTDDDIKRFSSYFGMSRTRFLKKYCKKTDGFYHLRDSEYGPDCMFLKDNKCSAYEARPTQCRTWPFWPENMNPKAWNKEVHSFCPGVGKGKLIPAKDIEKNLFQMKED